MKFDLKSILKGLEKLSELSEQSGQRVQNGQSEFGGQRAQNSQREQGGQRAQGNDAIVLQPSSHPVEEVEYGDNNREYRISFAINDAFEEGKSHAAEVGMLNTYASNDEYGREGDLPYVAVQMDDEVYSAVEAFKANGTFEGALELTPLSGKFYFKAKMEYYGDMMYFYGLDRCDGYWENNGLCMVYPKSYVGTESETKLMRVLDEVAESYKEELIG